MHSVRIASKAISSTVMFKKTLDVIGQTFKLKWAHFCQYYFVHITVWAHLLLSFIILFIVFIIIIRRLFRNLCLYINRIKLIQEPTPLASFPAHPITHFLILWLLYHIHLLSSTSSILTKEQNDFFFLN